MKTRLLTRHPISDKLKAASAALDAAIASGAPSLLTVERKANVDHIVRLFKLNPAAARAKTDEILHQHHGIGMDVRLELERQGLIASRSR